MPLEDLHREEKLEGSSDAVFGMAFSGLFAVVGLMPLRHHAPIRAWALAAGGVFLILALAWPASLTRLNRLWVRLGLLLSRIAGPVAAAVVFFLVVSPIGLLMRLLGGDPLRLKFAPAARSYWIDRNPPGPDPRSMGEQF